MNSTERQIFAKFRLHSDTVNESRKGTKHSECHTKSQPVRKRCPTGVPADAPALIRRKLPIGIQNFREIIERGDY
jgi:hypothetical protein